MPGWLAKGDNYPSGETRMGAPEYEPDLYLAVAEWLEKNALADLP